MPKVPLQTIRQLRWLVGALVCVALPGGSWLEGSRVFAWSMYARASELRIEVVAFDAAGLGHPHNPTALAIDAAPATAALLAGSDHWRPAVSVAVVRAHLDEFAEYACRELQASEIEVTLHERPAPGGERVTTRRKRCP